MKKIIIAGGSGFLGRSFIDYFNQDYQAEIIVLTRSRKSSHGNVNYVLWDGETLDTWADHLEHADFLLNLAGRTVNCRYHKKNREEILNSRVKSTRVLGEAIRHCLNPPRLWTNMSTATIYRDEYEGPNSEVGGNIGEGFSVNVAKEWEKAFFKVPLTKTRKIAIRTAIALGKDGDVFKIYQSHVKLRISGKHGHGRQWVSWIHEEDFYRSIMFLVENQKAEGIYNLSSPGAIMDRDFMSTFRKKMGYQWGLPIPAWMLTIGAFFLRTETELILKSRWVYPGKLTDEGFVFSYPTLDEGLNEMFNRSEPE